MPEQPGLADVIAGQREQLSRMRAAAEAKDRHGERELERRLSMDSSDSGTPSSKERTGAKEARRARQQPERERRTGRKRGGQPGHQGKGLQRDPDPDEKKDAEPPAECPRLRAGLGGAEIAGSRWAQLIDVKIIPVVTEWALPGLSCLCCGTVTFAARRRARIRARCWTRARRLRHRRRRVGRPLPARRTC